jgi:hypothetical protein
MSIAGQDHIYKESEKVRSVSTLSPKCCFDIVAQGFGCGGRLVEKSDEFAGATKKLIEDATKGQLGLITVFISLQLIPNTAKGMVGQTDYEYMITVPSYTACQDLIIRRNKRRRMALTEQVFHMAEARRHAVKINTTVSALISARCRDMTREALVYLFHLCYWSSYRLPLRWYGSDGQYRSL